MPVADHITLGYGPHYRLGATLARAEHQEALTALCVRHPGLRLADDAIPRRAGLLISSPGRLPRHLVSAVPRTRFGRESHQPSGQVFARMGGRRVIGGAAADSPGAGPRDAADPSVPGRATG